MQVEAERLSSQWVMFGRSTDLKRDSRQSGPNVRLIVPDHV